MTAAGWYPNPDGTRTLRYWDGTAWTDHQHSGLPAVTAPTPWPTQAPGGYGPPLASNSMATAALVLGILGAVIEWGGILTLTAGVLAIVFGAIGISRAGGLGNLGRGKAIAGLVLGCFALLAYLFWGLITFGFLWII